MKTLLLIDANSLIHRCYHALPPLTSSDGRPTGSLFGLSRILMKILEENKPDYIAAAFDRPEPTFRKEIFDDYKIHRPKADSELISQLIEAHNLFAHLGIKTFEKPGYEADDIIGTLSLRFKEAPNLKVIIFTGDLDALQLVEDGKVVVETFKKGISETIFYDEAAIKSRYELSTAQLIDYKALVGDQSDNIPGVPGIGPKTAATLLTKYKTLENLYKEIKEEDKSFKKLSEFKEQALLSKTLATIKRDVDLGVKEIEEIKTGVINNAELSQYFNELGFQSLANKIESKSNKNTAKVNISIPQNAIFFTDQIAIFNFKKDELASEKIEKIGFDLKSTIKTLKRKNIEIVPPFFDLSIGFWLLDSESKKFSPQEIFPKFFKKEYEGTTEDVVLAYNFVKQKIKELELDFVFEKIEMPLIEILAEMEDRGIGVDLKKLKILEKELDEYLLNLTKQIHQAAGEEFNLNSPKQLGTVLFEKLGISQKGVKKTKSGQMSTNFDNLLLLKGEHPIIDFVLDYREAFKIKSTYVLPIIELTDQSGRLHTNYIQTGTATGRLSSQNPNLQNIPQESRWSKKLRSCFITGAGSELVSFDYSQIELRILSFLTGDPKLISAFKNGADIHSAVAAEIFNVSESSVTPEMRRIAKTLNFGIVYGMGSSAFAKTSGLSRTEAKEFIDRYFNNFKKVREWQEEMKQEAKDQGFVKNFNGRRRYLPEISSSFGGFAAEAERMAVNMPAQSLAADIIKLAMIKTRDELIKRDWWGSKVKMILTIHDELLFEIDSDMMEEIVPVITKVMEQVFSLPVPLRVHISNGQNLGEMEKRDK